MSSTDHGGGKRAFGHFVQRAKASMVGQPVIQARITGRNRYLSGRVANDCPANLARLASGRALCRTGPAFSDSNPAGILKLPSFEQPFAAQSFDPK